MKKGVGNFVYWTPRILSILFILFLAMFSLDIFEGDYGLWATILGLFMHNIPAIILLVILLISWKYEIVGGIVFILAGIAYILFAIKGADNFLMAMSWSIIIAGSAFLIGILFLINWIKKKN